MRSSVVRIGALGVVVAGLSALPVEAGDPGIAPYSIRTCGFTPDSAAINNGEPMPLATVAFTGDEFFSPNPPGYLAFVDYYVDGVLVDSAVAPAMPNPVPGPPGQHWSVGLADQVHRVEFFAVSGSEQKVPGLLCTLTLTYGPAPKGGGEESGQDWNLDPDYFLGRVVDDARSLPATS